MFVHARLRRLARFALALGMVAFFTFAYLGFSHAAMSMGHEGHMAGHCKHIPGTAALCETSFLNHVSEWQGLFAAITETASLALLLIAAFGLVYSYFYLRQSLTLLLAHTRARWLAYLFHERFRVIDRTLQVALARGIVHSKAF